MNVHLKSYVYLLFLGFGFLLEGSLWASTCGLVGQNRRQCGGAVGFLGGAGWVLVELRIGLLVRKAIWPTNVAIRAQQIQLLRVRRIQSSTLSLLGIVLALARAKTIPKAG